jgi:hypothetical protein
MSEGARKDMVKIEGIQFELDGKAEEEASLLQKTNAVREWVTRPKGATLKKINAQERMEADNAILQGKFG